MNRNRNSNRIAILGLAAVLAFGATSCGDDDSGPAESGTTTTIDSPTRPSDPGDPTGSSEAETTEPGATTDPDDPEGTNPPGTTPNDSPLNDRLTDPSAVGAGFVPDATVGDGSFSTDLCEDITLDATWDDEASQALRRGTGDAATYYTEAILSFSEAGAAEEFVTAVVNGHAECLPETGVTERPDLADEAVVLEFDDGDVTTLTALVRTGSRVAVLGTAVDEGDSSPLTDALLASIAGRLA